MTEEEWGLLDQDYFSAATAFNVAIKVAASEASKEGVDQAVRYAMGWVSECARYGALKTYIDFHSADEFNWSLDYLVKAKLESWGFSCRWTAEFTTCYQNKLLEVKWGEEK